MQPNPPALQSPSCPKCGAPLRLAENTTISWDDSKKEFNVAIQGACRPCELRDEISLKRLPLLIAQSSSCSCGSELSLGSHSFKFRDGELEFNAQYRCTSCSAEAATSVQKILRVLRTVWRETTSIEVGPGGIKYSKSGAPESAPSGSGPQK